MTNTHITIGGHKVTTNKVGQVHTAENATGVTGTITWCVTNGMCTVSLSLVYKTGSGIVTSDIPKAKMYGIPYSDANGTLFIGATGLQVYGNLSSCNAYCIYPVADDWVES